MCAMWQKGPKGRTKLGTRPWLVVASLGVAVLTAACSSGAGSSASSSGAAQPTASQPLTTVRVVVQPTNAQDSVLYIAQQLGFAKKAGINLQFLVYASSPLTPLISGDADITVPSGPLALDAVSQGDGTKVIGTAIAGQLQQLVVRNGTSVSTGKWPQAFQGLRGKTVATTVVGGGADNEMRYLMLQAGVKLSDFNDLPAGSESGILAALQSGRAQAALVSYPFTANIVSSKIGYVGFDLVSDPAPPTALPPTNVLVASSAFAGNSSAVKQFMTAYKSAATYFANPANTATVVSELSKTLLKGTSTPDITASIQQVQKLLTSQCFTQAQYDASYGQAKALGTLGSHPVTYAQAYDPEAQPDCSAG
jgi:ABC-type nitrate/sulfonate/bicarbonate transport system substrate-binding protein